MRKSQIIPLFAMALALLSTPVLAGQSAANCDVDDLQISGSNADVIGCAGQFKGNDEQTDDWLENQTIWDANGVLTNASGAGTTSDSWIYFTKYDSDQGKFETNSSANWTGTLSFSNCKDKNMILLSNCQGGWNYADITFTFNQLLYDQFVVINKASGFFSLYQVDLLANVSSLTGTLSTVSTQALSHLTLWARETSGDPNVSVPAPATLGLFLFGFAALLVSKRRAAKR